MQLSGCKYKCNYLIAQIIIHFFLKNIIPRIGVSPLISAIVAGVLTNRKHISADLCAVQAALKFNL